jgi:hypothetical protein
VKKFLLVVALLAGCDSREVKRPLQTPARELECPICQHTAVLKRFSTDESEYECDDHDIVVDRSTLAFERASLRYKPRD